MISLTSSVDSAHSSHLEMHLSLADIENRQQDLDRSRGIPKRRCVRFVDPADQPRPRLSFTLIKYILRHPVNKPKVLRKNFEQLEELRNVLEVVLSRFLAIGGGKNEVKFGVC